MEQSIKSVLNMKLLQFEKISFERLGNKSDSAISYKFNVGLSRIPGEDIFKVELTLDGNKENEYHFTIVLLGIFSFDESINFSDDTKVQMIGQNAVAIMMPYMRSEVSLLTAQPDVDCVVMPPFNIVEMMKNKDQ